jgi:hypothetical protein
MNLVVSRTLLTLIFSSDTPIEDSIVSTEYENEKKRLSAISFVDCWAICSLSIEY